METSGLTVLAAHDAGGAQVLSSYAARRLTGRRLAFVLEGPAKDVFAQRLGPVRQDTPNIIDNLDSKTDRVLVATSWTANLERGIMAQARLHGVPCDAILDHWVHFRERFIPPENWDALDQGMNWTTWLPDTVIVTDTYAYDLALGLGFPPDRLRLEPNPYFEDVREDLAVRSCTPVVGGERRVLWIGEPISDLYRLKAALRPGFDEAFILEDLLRTLATDPEAALHVRLRPHPKERPDTYAIFTARSARISLSTNSNLLDDLAWADAVVGAESMALVVALVAGKSVFSYFPSAARRQCSLPHREIRRSDSLFEIFSDILRLPHKNG